MGDPDHSAEPAAASAARGSLSAGAWAAIATLGAAVITGGVTLATHLLPESAADRAAIVTSESAAGNAVGASTTGTATAPTATAPSATSPAATAPRSVLLDELTGRWTGEVTAGGQTFTMTLDITSTCAEGGPCGTMTTNLLPCVGDITLVRVRDGRQFDFATVRFSADSSRSCTLRPEGGDYFTLGKDVLAYVTGYDGSVGGTLERVG